jgi:hypothetical protein
MITSTGSCLRSSAISEIDRYGGSGLSSAKMRLKLASRTSAPSVRVGSMRPHRFDQARPKFGIAQGRFLLGQRQLADLTPNRQSVKRRDGLEGKQHVK